MFDVYSQSNLTSILRYFFFYIVTSFFFILDLISLSLPLTGEIRPFFSIIIIYYWSIYRPGLLHPVFLFFVGIIFDLVMWFPLGIHSVIFLAIQYVINNQRLFFLGQTYLVLWIGFIVTAASVFFLEWFFFSVLALNTITLKPIIASFFLTVMLFPLVAILLRLLGKFLPLNNKGMLG